METYTVEYRSTRYGDCDIWLRCRAEFPTEAEAAEYMLIVWAWDDVIDARVAAVHPS